VLAWQIVQPDKPPIRIPDEGERPKGGGGQIKPEPLPPLKGGEPLGPMALVQRPDKNFPPFTIETIRPRGALYAVAHGPKGRWVAVAGEDGAIRLLDAGKGTLVRVLVGHIGPCRLLAWSADGKVLASAYWEDGTMPPGTPVSRQDGTVRLWDPE